LSWDALGAIAELIGALGVIASLAYLAAQIRQNTRQMADHGKALRLSAQETVSGSFSRWRDPLIRDAEAVAVWMRGLSGTPSSREEEIQFALVLQELLFAFQNSFIRGSEGLLTDYWSRELKTIRELLGSPGAANWWKRNNGIFHAEFISAVEAAVSEREPAG
jgi:hypothetical protein